MPPVQSTATLLQIARSGPHDSMEKALRHPATSAMTIIKSTSWRQLCSEHPFSDQHPNDELAKHYDNITRTALKRKRVISLDPVALSPAAFMRCANKYYPLLTPDKAPFPCVNPAAVLRPTLQEAHNGITYWRTTPRLPTVTVHDLSIQIAKMRKRLPKAKLGDLASTNRDLAESATAESSATAVVGASGTGMMGPPPPPVQKRKRAEEDGDIEQDAIRVKRERM